MAALRAGRDRAWAVDSDGRVLASRDGVGWAQTSVLPLELQPFDVAGDDDEVTVVGYFGLASSNDVGTTWTIPLKSKPQLLAVTQLRPESSLQAAVGYNEMYISYDRGTSWAPRRRPGRQPTVALEPGGRLLVADGEYVWALHEGSWIRLETLGNEAYAVFSDAEGPVAVATRTGLVLWDGHRPRPISIPGFVSRAGIFRATVGGAHGDSVALVSEKGDVVWSTDGGATWTSLTRNARATQLSPCVSLFRTRSGTRLMATIGGHYSSTELD